MKEFSTKEGGRKIYNEDFVNLQELVMSLSGFLADCNLNFVISGCEVFNDHVSEGYVFLEGQIRKVDETKIGINENPIITPVTQVISGKYEDEGVSEIATIYGTKVISSSKFVSGVGINGVVDGGKYHFKSIADTFWNAYTIVKESEYPQDMDVLTNFTSKVFASNATLKKQGRTVKIEGDTVYLNNNDNTSLRLKISSDGEVSFIKGEENVLFKFNKNDTTRGSLNYVFTDTLNAEIISTQTLMLGSSNVKDTYFTIEEYADTGWHNLVRVSTGEEIEGIKARAYLGMVHIQGTLPQDFFSNVSYIYATLELMPGYFYNVLNTDVKLPDCIPSPSSEYINSFQVITPIFGTVGANVFITKESKRFFLVVPHYSDKIGELSPATDIGIAMFSFPFYSLNDQKQEIRQAVLGIREMYTSTDLFKFPDKSVCPSVSWQYSTDIPVELYSYTYSDSFDSSIKFNPDSYILHVFALFTRKIIKTDLNTGETTVAYTNYFHPDVKRISYDYCIFDENGFIVEVPSSAEYLTIEPRYITDTAVKQYDGIYSKDKEPLSGISKWASNGYDVSKLKTVGKTVKTNAKNRYYDKISINVNFEDSEYFTNKSDNLDIYGMDTKFHLGLDTHEFWQQLSNGTSRKVCDLFILRANTWEYYEYKAVEGGSINCYSVQEQRKCNISIIGGDLRFPYYWTIDEGAEFIEKIAAPEDDDKGSIYFIWTNKALMTKSKFRIAATLGKSLDSTNKKQAFIDIDPNQITLVAYSTK